MKHTCGNCTQTWTGLAMAHCSSCCSTRTATFSGVTAFDRHRSKGKCLDPATIKNQDGELVLELRTGGATDVWAFPTDPDFAERFASKAG